MTADEFEAIARRLLAAAAQLRLAIANGEADDPSAAEDLARRMERFAKSAIEGIPGEDIAASRQA